MVATREPTKTARAATAALLCAAVFAALAVLAAACGSEQPATPSGEPSIAGVAVHVSPVDEENGAVGSFLVENGSGDYDKASVTVADDTDWYRRDGDGVMVIERPTVNELSGKTVEVQFTGPVAESYPVQATAGWVIVAD